MSGRSSCVRKSGGAEQVMNAVQATIWAHDTSREGK